MHFGLQEVHICEKYGCAEKICVLCYMEEKIYTAIVITTLVMHYLTYYKVEFYVDVWRATNSAHIETY
jgi:hypothetical protein